MSALRGKKRREGTREFAFLSARFHDGGQDHKFHAEGGDGGRLGFVGGIAGSAADRIEYALQSSRGRNSI
jgi:hypothetical protein